jgi:anaphase-promoting complex subunit 12
MIRRSPTRIDLKLDDLAEYEALKKERDAKRENEKQQGVFNPPLWGGKTSQTEIQERIGYVPQTPRATQRRPNVTL